MYRNKIIILAFFFTIISLAMIPQPASAAWWNSTFIKKRAVYLSVASGSTAENFPAEVNITYDSDMNNDFSDLRFTDPAETTLYDHYLHDPANGNYVLAYIKIPDGINSTNQTLAYMYYDNTSVIESLSSGENVFTFYDNFSGSSLDTSKWTEGAVDAACADVYIENEKLKLNVTTGCSHCGSYVNSDDSFLMNDSFAVNFKWTDSSDGAEAGPDGLVMVDSSNINRETTYYGHISSKMLAITLNSHCYGSGAVSLSYDTSQVGWTCGGPTVKDSYGTFAVTYADEVEREFTFKYNATDDVAILEEEGTVRVEADFTAEMASIFPSGSFDFDIFHTDQNRVEWLLIDDLFLRKWYSPEPDYSLGSEEEPSGETLTPTLDPTIIYNTTDANCSVYYNHSGGSSANVTLNFSINNATHNITTVEMSPGSYYYIEVDSSNFFKTNDLTCAANSSIGGSDSVLKLVQNSPPTAPTITFNISSVIIGDTFNFSGSSSDGDLDTINYWYRIGYTNTTNLTNWSLTDNDQLVGSAHENMTFRMWVMGDDSEDNGTANFSEMIVTSMFIVYPVNGVQYTGDTFGYAFNISVNNYQPCREILDNVTYSLGNVTTGLENNSHYTYYGNHTYNVSCWSLQDPGIFYNKTVSFSNIFSIWNISIMTENDWETPLNLSGDANLSIIITCVGGETYFYNFTGIAINNIKPLCDVQTITAKADYASDSYARERVPPSCTECDVPMYMVDAMTYTVLQIPIYMSDYNYYDALIELYKSSGGNHYTIAQGYFDVERKYVTYLTKDNTYFIRLTRDDEVRDIGYLYAATATAQYLSLSQIELTPTIRLISDNLLMSAALDNASAPTTTMRIQYYDILNETVDVRVQVFQDINNTAFYDNTFSGISNLTISINNVNTSFRYSVHFTVNHNILGNSPVDFTIGVGSAVMSRSLGLPSDMIWLYSAFSFFIVLITGFAIVPENRIPGYIILIAEIGILSYFEWTAFSGANIIFFLLFPIAGLLYEIKAQRGVS